MKALLTAVLVPITILSFACSPANEPETAVEEHHNEVEESIVELSPEAAAGASLETAVVELLAMGRQLETTGQVGFDENRLAHVGPRISGRVERVMASLGDKVESGQALASVDSIELGRSKAEYLQARARHQLRLETYQREKTLYEDRISSEQEVLTARAALREAEAELATAEETLHLYGLSQGEVDRLGYDDPQSSRFSLRTPFEGTVVERHATRGELVEPGANLFTIADLSQVWVWIDIYERDLAGVHLGDDVEVRVDAQPSEVFFGKVTYLADQVDAKTRAVRARLDVPNPEGHLRAGMFARIRLSDPHSIEGDPEGLSTVVPEGAIQRDGSESIVFVALGNLKFERREVSTGRRAGGSVEVLDGVVPGEEVVVEGAFILKSEAAKSELGGSHAH